MKKIILSIIFLACLGGCCKEDSGERRLFYNDKSFTVIVDYSQKRVLYDNRTFYSVKVELFTGRQFATDAEFTDKNTIDIIVHMADYLHARYDRELWERYKNGEDESLFGYMWVDTYEIRDEKLYFRQTNFKKYE